VEVVQSVFYFGDSAKPGHYGTPGKAAPSVGALSPKEQGGG
jgi:hypothetical protein